MALYEYKRLTQFADSDAAGVIHFSRFGVYVEEAEHQFLKAEGLPLRLYKPDGYRWPRVAYSASHLRPLFPLEEILVELDPLKVGQCSITWTWSIKRVDGLVEVANGEMKSVCCQYLKGKMTPVELPENLRAQLTGSP